MPLQSGRGLLNSMKCPFEKKIKFLQTDIFPVHEDTTCGKQCALCAKSFQTLCDPVDCSPPGSSVHGILQARILEWVAMPSFKGSSQLGDQTRSPTLLADFFLPFEPPGKPKNTGVGSLFLLQGESSQPRNQTGVSCIAGKFFTS